MNFVCVCFDHMGVNKIRPCQKELYDQRTNKCFIQVEKNTFLLERRDFIGFGEKFLCFFDCIQLIVDWWIGLKESD